MILLEFDNKKYTINDNYEISPNNEIVSKALEIVLDSYNSPAQGFKTSYVAEVLKKHGFDILDYYDKELEDAPDGVVY